MQAPLSLRWSKNLLIENIKFCTYVGIILHLTAMARCLMVYYGDGAMGSVTMR